MIRKATREDAVQIAPLILVILEDMELPILKQISEKELRKLLIEGICHNEYRYSYQHIHVCERDGKIAGFAAGYPGSQEAKIDAPLQQILQKNGYEFKALRFFEECETSSGEWYLDSIVTKEEYRGCGVGTELLEALDQIATDCGEKVIGLNCDEGNPHAQRLYERIGFKVVGERMISQHRYVHMQKNIIN
ncbi:MAG: GNAT family N-acetyltransferase [Enterococcus sp.]